MKNNEVRQQIINGLSFDINPYFISNKGLTTRTQDLLKECNRQLERGTSNSFSKLALEYDDSGLALIKEILSNGHLITNLENWRVGLRSKNSIIDKFVIDFEENKKAREWILIELSRYIYSKFDSVKYFIDLFLIKLLIRGEPMKSIMSFRKINFEFYRKAYIGFNYIIRKATDKFQADKKFDLLFSYNILIDYWDDFYINHLNPLESKQELDRIIKSLVEFAVTAKSKYLLSQLIPILEKGGKAILKELFENLHKSHHENLRLWAKDFASHFIYWIDGQREIHSNYIYFIKGALISPIGLSVKKKLLQAYKNKQFFYFKNENKIFLTINKKNAILNDFIQQNTRIIEPDIKEFNQTKKAPEPIPLDSTLYRSLVSNIVNEDFGALQESLNAKTCVMNFIKYVRQLKDDSLQEKFNRFLGQEWIL